jgi:transposase
MLRKGCTPETLHSWHRKYLDSQNPSIVEQQSDKERIKQLERENRELRQANEIIRKAAGIEAQAEKGRKPK